MARLRFGICGSAEEIPIAREAGFDYVELWAAKVFGVAKPEFEGKAEVTNGFFSDEVTLFGPGRTPWQPYVTRLFERASDAGVQVMVVGSGRARQLHQPNDEQEFAKICGEMSRIAAKQGIRIAPEPLNGTECNLGNHQGKLAMALKSEDCAYTTDSYHVLRQASLDCRPVDWVAELPHCPAHVHVSNSERSVPRADDPDMLAFAARLRDLCYSGRVSFEGKRGTSVDDLKCLRSALGAIFS